MLMNYHIGRLVLSSLCVGVFAAADIWWCSFCRLKLELQVGVFTAADIWWCSFCRLKLELQPAKRPPPNISRSKNSNTQRTENKTTDVVIHQHSRRLLKMDILMSETC